MLGTALSFEIEAVDGEGIPVSGVEIGIRFRYANAPTTWSSGVTDGEGRAAFADEHPEPPSEVCTFVADRSCGSFPVEQGSVLVVEL